MITRFQEVQIREKRRGPCTKCGRRVDRVRLFSQTVNPFNKTEDGRPKTPAEVRAAVVAEADAWDPAPEVFDHAYGRCR